MGKKIALLLTGGIAAMTAPMIARQLRRYGAQVTAYVSEEGLKYVTRDALAWSTNNSVVDKLTARAEHLSDSQPYDIYLLAPATYNTINKVRHGIADTLITTTMASAIGWLEQKQTQIVVCPTMHGSMHNSILQESLEHLLKLGFLFIPPRDEYGKHNIPSAEDLVAQLIALTSASPLKGKKILVTGGPTPVEIDSVRRITNIFTGQLGYLMSRELFYKGVDVTFIQGSSGLQTPLYLNTHKVSTYDHYKKEVLACLDQNSFDCAIFSAAVADYKPVETIKGKVPSGGALKNITLLPTEKVIDLVRDKFPGLPLISFKYEENLSHEELMEIAKKRLDRGHFAIVANRGEEFAIHNEQVAYLVSREGTVEKIQGKSLIAQKIVNFLEKQLI